MAEMMSKLVVEYFGQSDTGNNCGYCKGQNTSISHGMWAHVLPVGHYKALIDRGWRRSGCYLYKPVMDVTCCPQYTIRLRVADFVASKSQKKVVRKFVNFLRREAGQAALDRRKDVVESREGGESPLTVARLREKLNVAKLNESGGVKFEIKVVSSSDLLTSGDVANDTSSAFEVEYNIYVKYQMAVHGDKREELTRKQFRRFLVDAPFNMDEGRTATGAFHYQYYINGRLMMVGVVDVLPHCLSSVYLFYDPHFAHLSPGTLSALFEICQTDELASSVAQDDQRDMHYYLGFYIHKCEKMRYKASYRPSQLLCPVTLKFWPIDDVLSALLDANKYVAFGLNREDCNGIRTAAARNPEADDEIDDAIRGVIVWLGARTLIPLSAISAVGHASLSETDMADLRREIREFTSLVGVDVARLSIFRSHAHS